MQKIRDDIKQKEERRLLLSDRVDKNGMAEAGMEAVLQGLQAGEKGEAAMRRKRLIVAGRRWWSRCKLRFPFWEWIRQRLGSRPCANFSSKDSKHQMRRCQEKKEGRRVKESKSKVKPVSSWCHQRQVGSMKALQEVLWSWIFLRFGVRMVKAEE